MHVTGLIDSPKWKKYFLHDDKKIDCQHCKYQTAENSIPKKNFIIVDTSKSGVKSNRTISKVRIIRGSHEDIIGWVFE